VKRNIITTADGSKTIQIEEWNEQYHSVHGAIQEAKHVFIKEGLYHYCSVNSADSNDVSILEIGFGTGLNAFITLLEADKLKTKIHYFGVEAFPVGIEEMNKLNYVEQLHAKNQEHLLKQMHESLWEVEQNISSFFTLTKQKKIFSDIKDINSYDIIYFDAFGSRVQPELWTETIFKKMYDALKINGVLVTYSAKGSVRRAMQTVGFEVERLQGPPGKREMLRASKLS